MKKVVRKVAFYFLFSCVAPSFYSRPVIAQEASDSRALSALDRAVEFYQQQPSFSIKGRETLSVNDDVLRRTAWEFDAQIPKRAALRVITLDDEGNPVNLITARLVGADSYSLVAPKQPEKITPIRDATERNAALTDLVNAMPSLGMSVAAFAFQTNPARTPSFTNARLSPGENGEQIVTLQGSVANEPVVVNNEYFLDARSGALKRLRARTRINGKTVTILTEFDLPQSNWQGSQAATDAAVYNREKLAPMQGATARATVSVKVEPVALATFERSIAFYQKLRGLHLVWRQSKTDEFGDETTRGNLDYEGNGRLRLQFSTLLSSLIVVDGSQKWVLESELINPDGPPRYRREDVDKKDLESTLYATLRTTFGLPAALSGLVGPVAINPLSPLMLSSMPDYEGFVSFEAHVLESQLWNGEECELVQTLDVREGDSKTADARDIHQIVYWFARSDGRLLRVQEGQRSGDETATTTDSQIIEQTFDPTFTPDTFKFTPPAGAIQKTE